jgi:hypothetical protein
MCKAAKALLMHKKGSFLHDCEMYEDAQREYNRALIMFNSINEAYKLKFINLFQEIFNS